MADLSEYQKFWREQSKREEEKKSSLLEFLRHGAKEAAKILAKEYQAGKVYLIGSTASGALFHEHSDVDLVVKGLPPQKYFSALAKIQKIFSGKSRVDLIPLEDATPAMAKKVESEGELLYG